MTLTPDHVDVEHGRASCDRCNATARVLVRSPQPARRDGDGTASGQQQPGRLRVYWRILVLCAHHWHEYGVLLSIAGWVVEVDTRGDLVAQEDARFRDPRPGHPRSTPPLRRPYPDPPPEPVR